MRTLLLLLVAGCGGKPDVPAKPDVSKMGPEQKCLATAPRGTMCNDELLVGELRALEGDPGFADAIGDGIKDDPSSPRDNLRMHRMRCLGSASYADALVRCWDQPDCKALAECIFPTHHEPSKTGAAPR